MEFKARTKSTRVGPRKVRLVADAIRKTSAHEAMRRLSVADKRAAYVLGKVLKSAMANAVNNGKAKEEALMVKFVEVSEGPALKRYHPSTRGRVHPYKRRSSHITIILEERKKSV